MSRIVLEVTDEQKSDFVLELLSSLDFVDLVNVEGKEDPKQHFRPHVNPNRAAMLQEQAAYDEMKDALIKEHLGKYVAVFQGSVIDHDEDEVTLISRIRSTHGNATVLIKQVSHEPDRILHFRSPRLVRAS